VIKTLSTECPSEVNITHDNLPFEPGDVLTCIADGYNPTYTWTGIAANGDITVSHTGSLYTLPEEGDFDVICTATVSELTCTGTASSSVDGTAIGKYQIQLNTLVTMLTLITLSACYLDCLMLQMLISTT